MEVERKSDDMNLITTTHNCQVKVFCQRQNGSFYSQNVNCLAGVEQRANIAAKKTDQSKSAKISQLSSSSSKNLQYWAPYGCSTKYQLNSWYFEMVKEEFIARNIDNQASKKLNNERNGSA